MKNRKLLYGVIIVVLVNFYFFGCSPKTSPPENTAPPVVEETNKPIDWKQEYFSSFSIQIIKDSISFYPNDTIKFRGQSAVSFEEGKVRQIDTTVVVAPLTPGKLVGIKKSSDGKIVQMDILYEKNSKYAVPFLVNPDRTFSVRGGKAKAVWYLENTKETKILNGIEVQPQ
jgi:hypothetical protein